jgi:hypothetical protein
MTVTKRMLITGALALSMGLGVGVALVTAKAAHETDSLIYFTAPSTLNGNITSPEPKCEPNRKATVRKSRQGPDRKLGTDKSAGDGWYTVTTPNTITSGKYYAKIARRDTNAGVCAAAKSNTTTITGP